MMETDVHSTHQYKIFLSTLVLIALAWGSAEQPATDGRFVVITNSEADRAYLSEVFAILQEAQRELEQSWQLNLPQEITIVIHPTLQSFIKANQVPWYIAGTANVKANQVDLQRLKVLVERDILKSTLRHELFHLTQSDHWPRWLAEGLAMHFAEDKLLASPIKGITETKLNNLLANPKSQDELYSARATAFSWSKPYLTKLHSN